MYKVIMCVNMCKCNNVCKCNESVSVSCVSVFYVALKRADGLSAARLVHATRSMALWLCIAKFSNGVASVAYLVECVIVP